MIGFVLLIANLYYTLYKNIKLDFKYAVLFLLCYCKNLHWDEKRTEIRAYYLKNLSKESGNAGSLIDFNIKVSCLG